MKSPPEVLALEATWRAFLNLESALYVAVLSADEIVAKTRGLTRFTSEKIRRGMLQSAGQIIDREQTSFWVCERLEREIAARSAHSTCPYRTFRTRALSQVPVPEQGILFEAISGKLDPKLIPWTLLSSAFQIGMNAAGFAESYCADIHMPEDAAKFASLLDEIGATALPAVFPFVG